MDPSSSSREHQKQRGGGSIGMVFVEERSRGMIKPPGLIGGYL